MSQYKVAIIGCGKRARPHLNALKADPRCQIAALADLNRDAADKLNTEHQLSAAIYTDYTNMLARERPDVVAICLWTHLHLPVIQSCIDAGVRAILSEKPMAVSWSETRRIAEIADRATCQLTFCHQRRFAEGNQLVRRLIAEGRFGQIERLDLYSPQHLLDCGTHTFDQALSFNNESPAKWVLAGVDATAPLNYFNVKAETMAVGRILFQNGVRAFLQCGGPDLDMPGGARIHGTEGFIEVWWDGQIKRAVCYKDPSWHVEPPPDDRPKHMLGAIRNAIDCLETGQEPELSHRKALRAAEIIFALYESIRRHARVELPLTDVDDHPFMTMLAAGDFDRGHSRRVPVN